MKVLQICLKPPLPQIDGGCKAMNNITQGLLENEIEVKVLTLSTFKHPFKKETYTEKYISQTKIESCYIDTKIKPLAAFFNLFSSKSYNIERFYNKKFESLIIKVIQKNEFDIVLLESLYVSKYVAAIRGNTTAKIIYRAHNVESEIWERNTQQAVGFRKWYLRLLTKKLSNYEKSSLNSFNGIAAITQKDKENLLKMGCKIPIEVFPFGINISDYPTTTNLTKNTIFHIGSMDWKPNLEGIKWFLDNVWNDVVKKNKNATFNIAGKDMPSWLLKRQQQNVTVLGKVENVNNFMSNNAIMVVPLFAASGMRIKIIEGMALGKLVIATSVAAEGINYIDKKNIIIADTPTEMRDAIIYYLNNKKEQLEIAKSARLLMKSDYDNKIIVGNLLAFFKEI